MLSYDNRLEDQEPASYIVENERLRQALIAAAHARPAVALLGGSAIGDFAADQHGVTLRLASGTLRAPVLIAADGRASRLRDSAGIKLLRWDYPQAGIVTTVAHSRPHGGRALQHFLPTGPFAILPLPQNRSAITWTEDATVARALLALDEAGFAAELAKRFDYRLGEVTQIGARAAWPLEMQLARALIADRLALVGDAARVVHPIAGQGLNLGLRDVAALTEVIADAARLGLDTGAAIVLERYQRWRRLDSALSAATYDGLNRLFSNDWTAPAHGARFRPRPGRSTAGPEAILRGRSRRPQRRDPQTVAWRATLAENGPRLGCVDRFGQRGQRGRPRLVLRAPSGSRWQRAVARWGWGNAKHRITRRQACGASRHVTG